MNLKIYKMKDDVTEPIYGSLNSACFDLFAYIPYQSSVRAFTKDNKIVEMLSPQDSEGNNFIELPTEWRVMIPTGLIFDIPENYSIRIYSRSGLSTQKGLNLINSVGIIDSDYIEQVFIPVYNNSQEKIKIYNGLRIAQAEIIKNDKISFEFISERPERKTDRSGGFGSTGLS
jgi:dUTP pyrophosphatase